MTVLASSLPILCTAPSTMLVYLIISLVPPLFRHLVPALQRITEAPSLFLPYISLLEASNMTGKMSGNRNIVQQFDEYFGNASKVANWQMLCFDLDIEGDLSSITKCKSV
jgi:hypothetical protein